MLKKLNKKGFTLAELLIVVAIIGVLVAISIPIFTQQLKKAHLATNQANARAAYAATVAKMLEEEKTSGRYVYTVATAKLGAYADSTGDGDAAVSPNDWSYDTGSTATYKVAKLGTDTATAWTIDIDATGNIKYTPTWP
ncbi:hypothetical protein BXO88_15030 [Oribacterium sp. C9]|uniref:type IV pilin protein n=1 Tax=Oribacterium sp. C9 TaxID=1943579 RepID=UPI00098FF418|nr:prepilin-type N-terminal cleavage/methylation domain-containing protein [Oribacterium sp. C9]OON84887.1 hypothetical protein BXO88_15030 [Oribacterium sp. C9]